MKRFCLSVATLLFLAACSSQQTVRYELTIQSSDQAEREGLVTTSMQVVQRRLAALEEMPIKQTINTTATKPVLVLTLKNKEVADALTQRMVQPFDVEIMAEAQPNEKPDVTIEGQGGFMSTGITEKDLLWVEAARNNKTNKGAARILLTEDGKKKLQTLFKKMQGKNIGIFVRGSLVSKLLVKGNDTQDVIYIGDIPSPDIAQIFADDMNVGLHVTFTLVP